ncbi:aspartic peptidase A1 [Mycena sanguinolenta]|nr:aspartic peptidase A1 [Mycena sanguinolenta]
MLSILPLSILALVLSHDVSATPAPQQEPRGFSMNLRRRVRAPRSAEEVGVWAKSQREGLIAKYSGKPAASKRSTGTNLLVNQGGDASFYGSLAIGTPAVSYDVILDTGSADLWLAGKSCNQGCSNVPTFDPSSSSTFTNSSTSFSVQYGSGAAVGSLGSDRVQMAGFVVSNQVFAVCDAVTDQLLTSPVSGLLGLGWQAIASSGAEPFAQTLGTGSSWDSQLMAFQLTRFHNQSQAQEEEAGGSFSMGFTNTSLYTGEIEYINIPTTPSYWILPITTLTVQGNAVSIPSGENSYAAIDTGTTLVGGPPDQIAAVFAQIPDSQPGTGNFDGYYLYPCSTTVTVTLSFGGSTWAVSPADFLLQKADTAGQTCVGSFFALTTGDSAPPWIVGDTFLKNVYSVFRFSPPSVGFAQLSATALAMNGDLDLAVPTPTIGSVAAEATAGSSGGRANSVPSAATTTTVPRVLLHLVPVVVMLVVGLCW